MEDSLFRNYDNNNKYVKAPYQGAVAKIGHLEYLYDYLKENLLSDWTANSEGYNVGVVLFDTNGLYRNTVEGNTTQPSVNSPSNGWVLLAGTPTAPYEPPYKVYTALLTQTGTSVPTVTVLENTLGFTITWAYVGVGQYTATASGGTMPLNKTTTDIGSNYTQSTYDAGVVLTTSTASVITVWTYSDPLNGTSINGFLSNTKIEIRVYE